MLYIIATPIGNLGDITLRAIETLETVEILLCEDTRVSGGLLQKLAIKNKPQLVSFYDEVEEQKIPQIIKWLEEGKEVGLVTDAGTPLISDPGWRLVKKCQEKKLAYTALPGASAVIDALVLSGLPTDRFYYLGFLPKKDSKRRELLEQAKAIKATKVAYESPFRVKKLMAEITEIYGTDRHVSICRELTKKFEEVATDKKISDERGEVVVVWQ